MILERKGERERERERERNISVREKHRSVAPCTCSDWGPVVGAQTGDGTRDLGVCPAGESNPRPFSLWDNVPTN